MRRPEIPHKKTFVVIALIFVLVVFACQMGLLPDINLWWFYGPLVVMMFYVLYWAIRQECWGYTIMNIVFLLLIGVMIFVTNRLEISLDAQLTSGTAPPDVSASGLTTGLYVAIGLFIAIVVFDAIAMFFILQKKRYPRASSLFRQYLWPVNLVLNFFAWLSVILTI